MKKKSARNLFVEKNCAICNKYFLPTHYWTYRLIVNGKSQYYCSYTCWRKDGGGGTRYVTK